MILMIMMIMTHLHINNQKIVRLKNKFRGNNFSQININLQQLLNQATRQAQQPKRNHSLQNMMTFKWVVVVVVGHI